MDKKKGVKYWLESAEDDWRAASHLHCQTIRLGRNERKHDTGRNNPILARFIGC
ncbi:MAG: hypothetical protein AABZ11_09310 [Nitrospinota bacterium]